MRNPIHGMRWSQNASYSALVAEYELGAMPLSHPENGGRHTRIAAMPSTHAPTSRPRRVRGDSAGSRAIIAAVRTPHTNTGACLSIHNVAANPEPRTPDDDAYAHATTRPART